MGKSGKKNTSSTNNHGKNLNKDRNARSSAPSPSINNANEFETVLQSVEIEILPLPTRTSSLGSYSHRINPQSARSDAPPPGVSSHWVETPYQVDAQGEGPAPERLTEALSRVAEDIERGRGQSDALSSLPSSSPSSSPTPSDGSEYYVITSTSHQPSGAREGQVPRSLRSSAPSPDRHLTTVQSGAPLTSILRESSGIVPPKNTPVKPHNTLPITNSTCKPFPSPHDPSPRGPAIQRPPLIDTPAYHQNHDAFAGYSLIMSTQAEEHGGGYSSDEADDGDRYSAESDKNLMEMLKESITKTVTVTHTPAAEATSKFGTFGSGSGSASTSASVPTMRGSNAGTGGRSGTGGGSEWNPPLAPNELKSHTITWVNDKKIGERINGVQVPWEEMDEYGFEGLPKGEEGKKEGKKPKKGKGKDGKVVTKQGLRDILSGLKKENEKPSGGKA
ncbi:uncharacterized protein RSE6_12684 [Rhynchosporium secalis]|uniref:Uncharacterized protein n=1 Tax=Rhynchosporium secalis TaxID=38038 RepID=A0A1E1MR11_RHYSE|nr:uncharacterized protein RSE6_12684 [Rhynchosporium secalis]